MMKVLVLNGSPKREKSDCLLLTRTFLRGLGAEAELLHAVDLNVKPCTGCFGCWQPHADGGVQQDDMKALLPKIIAADLVIWSFPLYCFDMPAPLKAIVDRLLPLTTHEQEVAADGRTYHPCRQAYKMRFMMISGCGFPNLAHNYEGMAFQFAMQFGADYPRITCTESPMLQVPEARAETEPYLAAVEQAGREFARDGRIAPETQQILDTPMIDPAYYRAYCSRSIAT